MNSCELASFVTAVACGIAKCVPKEDLPLIAAAFGQIAATLATITVQEEMSEKKEPITPEFVPITDVFTEQTNT